MKLLCHRNIRNTLIYTQLVEFKDDEYVSKVARNAEEACQLVEAGFEYVCEMDDVKIFRNVNSGLKSEGFSSKSARVGFEPTNLFSRGVGEKDSRQAPTRIQQGPDGAMKHNPPP